MRRDHVVTPVAEHTSNMDTWTRFYGTVDALEVTGSGHQADPEERFVETVR